MWYGTRDKVVQSLCWGNQDKTRIRAVAKSYLLCYTRERVKREEKKIIQHHTTSLYIHFVYQTGIIPQAPMYHPNILSCSYTPPTPLLINNTTPPHPTSQHLRPLPYHIILHRHHVRIYQRLCLSITQIPSIHLIIFVGTTQPMTCNPSLDSIPLLGSRSSENSC